MIAWQTEYAAALAQATATRRTLLLDFTKDRCAGCAMDEISFAEPAIAAFVAEHFVALRLRLNDPVHRPIFRNYRIVWTPSLAMVDHRGVSHYQSSGYLPPDQLFGTLSIGLARTLAAWTRYDEAAAHLATVADTPAQPMAAEALFWLGAVRYLQHRRREPMLEHWRRLQREHPQSQWAARVPPNQETYPEEE